MTGMNAYVVHDESPSFHRDALEHGEHRQAEVVEVGNTAVRSDPVCVTDPASLRQTLVSFAARPRRIQYHLVCRHVAYRVAMTGR